MPPRRDFLKATAGLVLATAATWLATHADGAVPDRAERPVRPQRALAAGNLDAGSPDRAAAAPRVPTSQP